MPSSIVRFSSLRQPLGKVFLADRLQGAKAYKRIAGYFRSSILELVGEQIEDIPDVRMVCNSELDPQDVMVSQAARNVALKERWNQQPLEVEAFSMPINTGDCMRCWSVAGCSSAWCPRTRCFYTARRV